MGYGDVRLSGVLGIALGYLGWGAAAGRGLRRVPRSAGSAAACSRCCASSTGKAYPFGPFMLLGALVGVLWGARVCLTATPRPASRAGR